MVDSTAAHERDAGASSYLALSGDRPGGERSSRTQTHDSDGPDGAGLEHASALLGMGAVKMDAGEYSEAEELFGRALAIGQRSPGPDGPGTIPALTGLASANLMAGKLEAAQQLATRIVYVSENGLAEHEPDVAIFVNDLARLCLKQSAHGVAEPLLLRLLAMKRSKGEDHPEVGTVLASLATVRQALGRHESAEQLWRRVLEIRERTLAPNHFSLALALEHLAEACAARGKIGEALQLFQRAQTMREFTLGAGHPSLRISRDRIADLQLQAQESIDAPHEVPAPALEKYRLLSVNPSVNSPIVSPQPPVRDRSAPSRKSSARVLEREPSRLIERELSVEEFAPPSSPPAAPPVVMDTAIDTEPPKAEPASYRDVILSIQQEMEDEDGAKATPALGARLLAPVVAAVRERQKATIIGVGVVALLVVLATVSRAWTESDVSATSAAVSFPATNSATTPSGADVSGRPPALASDAPSALATASAAATPVTASRIRLADRRPADQRSAAKKPTERSAEPTRISIPKVPSVSTAGFDSIVRERSGSSGADGNAIPVQPTFTAPQRMTFERDDQANPRLRAQLIGPLPTPRYPAQLQGVEGELTARFEVDALGRPVMSSVSVVNSPHELLTAAVLKVMPGIRFEPARSGGADSKPVADIVQLTFRFQAKR